MIFSIFTDINGALNYLLLLKFMFYKDGMFALELEFPRQVAEYCRFFCDIRTYTSDLASSVYMQYSFIYPSNK